MNGYFQIVERGGKCHVKLVPPTNGGEPIQRDELFEYLNYKNITFDMKLLVSTLAGLESVAYFPTITDFLHKDGEYVKVTCAPDAMSVTVRMIPCFDGGEQMSKEEFMREFTGRGISYGYDDAAIDAFLANREYCKSVVLVRGTPPVQGEDAKIEYFFNTNPRVRPTLNEDGTVDFFHLNTINHINAGDLLARLTPAVLGTPGKNVKGEVINPREVKSLSLKYGHNIRVNETETEAYSEVSGHVSLVEGKIFVSNVLEVENVDNSVGNIDYDGSVQINGNVCENFTVKAKGSIEVRGVVEGAYLEAGENITIIRGMNGMRKGELKAGGNVVAKFLENAKVIADGFVEADTILHSNITAGTDIRVSGSKGFIAGGRACATNSVEVKNLGSQMGADTIIEVGMDTGVKTTMQELKKEIVEINKQLTTIRPVLDGAKAKIQQGIRMTADQLGQIQKLALLSKELNEKLQNDISELNKYQDTQDSQTSNTGQVIVRGDVYPGTKVVIGDVSMVVKSTMKYCRFIKEGGEVKMVGIN